MIYDPELLKRTMRARPELFETIAQGLTIYRKRYPQVSLTNGAGWAGIYQQDERIMEMMRSRTPIKSSIVALNDFLLGHGWHFQAAEGADNLREYAAWAFRGTEGFSDFLRALSVAYYDGWAPFRVRWELGTFQGRPAWRLAQMDRWPGHLFGVTVEDRLALHHGQRIEVAVYPMEPPEIPADGLVWFVARAGEGPYGSSYLLDLWADFQEYIYHRKILGEGVRNAVRGIPIVKEVGPNLPLVAYPKTEIPSADDPAAQEGVFRAMIEEVSGMLEEDGVLGVRRGFEVAIERNPDFVTGCLAAMKASADVLRVAIEGQTLTATNDGATGSRALGDVHQQTKIERARAVGAVLAGQARALLEVGARATFGPAVVDKLPRFAFNISEAPDAAKVTAVQQLGGNVDVERMAELWRVPLDEAQPRTPRPSVSVVVPGREQERPLPTDLPETDAPTRERSAIRTREEADQRRMDSTAEALAGEVEEGHRAHMSRLLAAVLDASGTEDPPLPLASRRA